MPITNLRDKVETIVILMLENRSFDHMFSFLTLGSPGTPARRADIDGIRSLVDERYVNVWNTKPCVPWLTNDDALIADLPHGRELVSVQLRGTKDETAEFTMGGFAEAYSEESGFAAVDETAAAPMSIQSAPWMMDYFAQHHMVCDRWFAPLPTDTQPNRLMALSGVTKYDTTVGRVITQGDLVFDWLTERKISWRVYRQGLPFEALIKSMWDDVVNPRRFRSIKDLIIDILDDQKPFPSVVFLEPAFSDAPGKLGYQSNDDHPPTAIGQGQQFLREAYATLSANPKRWKKTVMIVTYDEHGGFYDHVEPIPVTAKPPKGANWTAGEFKSTGIRVPAVIASPLVEIGSVYHEPLDHTSILQFIASVFGKKNEVYSPEVDDRRNQGIGNVADALNSDVPRTKIPPPPETAPMSAGATKATGAVIPEGFTVKKGENAKAFEAAAKQLAKAKPKEVQQQYKEIVQWLNTD